MSESRADDTQRGEQDQDNFVFLRGRLADAATARELPSGDMLTSFRLTVGRPPGEHGHVDSLDCATTRSRVRRSVEAARVGDVLEVKGSLRRRFWRSPGGLASRYTVEVKSARIAARAPRDATGRTTAAVQIRTRASV